MSHVPKAPPPGAAPGTLARQASVIADSLWGENIGAVGLEPTTFFL